MSKASAHVIAISPTTGKTLMGKKAKTGKWSFFGGKIKKGEDPQKAAAREFVEETGVFAANLNQHLHIIGPGIDAHVFFFSQLTENGLKIRLSDEHSEYKWFDSESDDIRNEDLTEKALIIMNCIYKLQEMTEQMSPDALDLFWSAEVRTIRHEERKNM